MFKEEKNIQESLEKGNWKSVKNLKSYKKKLIKAAKNTINKDSKGTFVKTKSNIDKKSLLELRGTIKWEGDLKKMKETK